MYKLPSLNYDYNALEPHFDETTMRIHHTKHHQAYIDKLNKAMEDNGWSFDPIEDVLKKVSQYNGAVRNNGGGFYNHSFFWKVLTPEKQNIPSGAFSTALRSKFGDMEGFKKEFSDAAATRFGSGWTWLSVDNNKELFISSTPNQDNPLMDIVEEKGTPILGLDVWEHAYYLRYQNKRPDYIKAFFELIHWKEVAERYEEAIA